MQVNSRFFSLYFWIGSNFWQISWNGAVDVLLLAGTGNQCYLLCPYLKKWTEFLLGLTQAWRLLGTDTCKEWQNSVLSVMLVCHRGNSHINCPISITIVFSLMPKICDTEPHLLLIKLFLYIWYPDCPLPYSSTNSTPVKFIHWLR